jgi:hypothetical protein
MNSISVNQFRDNLKTYIEQTVSEHESIKATTTSSKYTTCNISHKPEVACSQ